MLRTTLLSAAAAALLLAGAPAAKAAVPVNDSRDDATVLAASGATVNGTTVGATYEALDEQGRLGTGTQMGGWFRKPIKSLADLKEIGRAHV